MTKKELIEHWVSSSDGDFKTMEHMFATKDYHWALFIGHLVIEKLLKAMLIKVNDTNELIPHSHNLLILAQRAKLEITNEQKVVLENFNSFYLNARYEEYKTNFYKRATRSYTTEQTNKIKEYRLWLKTLLIQ